MGDSWWSGDAAPLENEAGRHLEDRAAREASKRGSEPMSDHLVRQAEQCIAELEQQIAVIKTALQGYLREQEWRREAEASRG